MTAVRRSLIYSLSENYLGVLLQLLGTLIVSRLLTPSDIGIFSVAAVLSGLATTFRDFGIAEYMIQEQQLTRQKIRAAFAANIIVSWLMAALLLVSSAWVGRFYAEPGVSDVLRVLSISFLLVPFGAVTMAYFRREMNYRPIFIISSIANVSGFLVIIICAWQGLGYMSMAWSSLATMVCTVVLALMIRPRALPRWPSLHGLGEVFHFGRHATGIYFFSQVGRSAPEAVIGRVLDMAGVAFYSRANGLMEIFNRTVLHSVMPVCLPYFSKAVRDGEDSRDGYIKAISLLTAIGWPFFVFMGLLAPAAIRILYGPQWAASVPLAQILCLVAVLELPFYLSGEMLIAAGRIDLSTRLQFSNQCLRVAGLALILPFGLAGACWGLALAALVNGVIAQACLRRVIGFRSRQLVGACRQSALLTLGCGLPAYLLLQWVGGITEANFLRMLVTCAGLTLGSWLLGVAALRHPIWLELRGLIAKLLNKRDGKLDS